MSSVLGTVGIAVPVPVLLILLLSLVILALSALSMRMHNARLDEWAAEDSADATPDDETPRTDDEVTAPSRLTHEGDGADQDPDEVRPLVKVVPGGKNASPARRERKAARQSPDAPSYVRIRRTPKGADTVYETYASLIGELVAGELVLDGKEIYLRCTHVRGHYDVYVGVRDVARCLFENEFDEDGLHVEPMPTGMSTVLNGDGQVCQVRYEPGTQEQAETWRKEIDDSIVGKKGIDPAEDACRNVKASLMRKICGSQLCVK